MTNTLKLNDYKPRQADIAFGTTQQTSSDLIPAQTTNPYLKPQSADNNQDIQVTSLAYKARNGDILFSPDQSHWYIKPNNSDIAYGIEGTSSGIADGSQVTGTFKTSINGPNKILNIYEKQGKRTFDSMPLEKLTDAEKTSLRGAVHSYTEVPDVRGIEYALQAPDGDYLIITSGRGSGSQQRIFSGRDLNHLEEIPMNQFHRKHDGGTTDITTNAGTLHIPSAMSIEPAPITWTPADGSASLTMTELDSAKTEQKITNNSVVGIPSWEAFRLKKSAEQFKDTSSHEGGTTIPKVNAAEVVKGMGH